METTFTGGATRLWLFAGNPDNAVHNSSGVYADTGEIFMNTNTQILFFCYQGGTSQSWTQITFNSQLQSAMGSILQSDWNQTVTTAQDFIKNKPTIPNGQIQSDWTQANTAATDFIKNKPAAKSQSSATRALNTIFQVNATRWSTVRYSIDISTTVSLTGSQVGRVVLEMATNSAFTSGVQELQSFGNGNTGALVVGLVLTQLNTACLSGEVPPGNYVRLRTVNTTGTPTFTYISGQETLQ
jgi:hypothetical protein